MDGSRSRVSYGIDATESPIVAQALHEIATHPLLKPMLEGLVGEDPAITEITAITSWLGAKHQGWHADIKQNGNPTKFGRTYSHSYSLFLPLQDTTTKMGATGLCPGTHYCSNWMGDVCDTKKTGFPLSEASDDGVWKAGDGALLNQQVWHRGTEYTARKAPHRAMFIVSFIGRPRFGTDPRQLSKGTYFHIRWNMWGHTLRDMVDAGHRMTQPFSALRSFGLWKSPKASWGYDLVTSGFLRMANEQQGMHWSDLPVQIEDSGLNRILPEWLLGPVLENKDAHTIFLVKTLEKLSFFLLRWNIVLAALYLLAMLINLLYTRTWRRSVTIASLTFLIVYGIPLLVTTMQLNKIQNSEWGSNIRANRTLMAPFSAELARLETLPTPISDGPTTMPEREDVLWATRFDSSFLGAYEHWIDYHPGNTKYLDVVQSIGLLQKNYSGLPKAFRNSLVGAIVDDIHPGRFLEQDWRNGDWRTTTEHEHRTRILQDLAKARKPQLAMLDRVLSRTLARFRFEASFRETALALKAQSYASHLKDELFKTEESCGALEDVLSTLTSKQPTLLIKSSLPKPVGTNSNGLDGRRKGSSLPPKGEILQVGDSVMSYYEDEGEWFRASITDSNDAGVELSYDEGTVEVLESLHGLRHIVPLEEGARVKGNYNREGTFFPGIATRVRPDGFIDIRYEDGDFEKNVKPKYYKRLDY